MAKYIPLDILVAEIERRKKYYENLQMIKPVYESNIEDLNELLSFLDTLEAKEINSKDTFIEKAWEFIEDNLLSSNQQDKSRLYYEQFKNYMKGE